MRSMLLLLLRRSRPAAWAGAFWLLAAACGAEEVALASTPAEAATLPPVDAIAPSLRTPDLLGDPSLASLWADSVEAEATGDSRRAAEIKRRILDLQPGDVHTSWRLARDLMVVGEAVPIEDKEQRLAIFEEARARAGAAAAADPGCVECCFYHFASTSRIATVKGAMRSVGLIKESGIELERCLALEPSVWTDNEWNHERANLYYGAAVYYRMVPDTWWIERMLGFRGDKLAAVRLARQAADVVPSRIDYRVELGVALVCLGEAENDPAARAEGLTLLADLNELPTRMDTDALDRARAQAVRADPGIACDNARSFELE